MRHFHVINKKINEIPFLIIYDNFNTQKNIVFLFHKLLQNKESELPLGYNLAQEGYFVVIVDMCGHGERKNSYDKLSLYDFNYLYKDIYNTSFELRYIIHFLSEEFNSYICLDSMTAIGASIGSSVALSCGYMYPKITRIVSLIGSLDWEYAIKNNLYLSFRLFAKDKSVIQYDLVKEDIKEYNPLPHYLNSSKPRILFMNGKMDMTISIESVKRTYNSFCEIYTQCDQANKIEMRLFEKTGHQVTNRMIEELKQWLKETKDK